MEIRLRSHEPNLSGETSFTLSKLRFGSLLGLGLSSGSLDSGLLGGEDELDVRGRRHVRVDTTVGTVSSSSQLGSLVGLDVVDNQGLNIESLHFGVGLGVLQEVQQEATRLLGPSSLGGSISLGLSVSSDTVDKSSEGDGVLVGNDVLQVGLGASQGESLDGLAGLAGVLEVNTQVRATGLNRPIRGKSRERERTNIPG